MTRISEHDRGCDPATTAGETVAAPGPHRPPRKASLWRVLRDQKKTILVAVVMVVATYWIAGQFGEWELAGCIAGGVLLGLANHLMTEHWLLRIITSGAEPTRSQMVASTLLASACSPSSPSARPSLFWPNGIGLAAGPGHLPTHRPGHDRAAPAEGAEARMTNGLITTLITGFPLAEGGEEQRQQHRDRSPRPA